MTLFSPPAEREPEFTNAPEILDAALAAVGNAAVLPALEVCADSSPNLPREGAVTMVLHTWVGGGPVRLTESDTVSLLDMSTGLPKSAADTEAIAFGAVVGDGLSRAAVGRPP